MRRLIGVVARWGRGSSVPSASSFLSWLAAGGLAVGCVLGGNNDPRPDDLNAVRPSPPTDAVPWTALDWADAPFEQPAKVSLEQWDQPVAVAAGPGGFVAVGSNTDVTGYVGRIWSSPDGMAWKLVSAAHLQGLELIGIAASGSTYVAIGTASGDVNNPDAVMMTSADGLSWTVADLVHKAWAVRIASGPAGFAAVVETGDTADVLFSTDGTRWSRVPGQKIADGVYISDIAADGEGWIAAGSIGDRAVVLRTSDGRAWTEEALPGSKPIGGIINVAAYRVVPGRWATVALGIDQGTNCKGDNDFCDKYQVAWSWTTQTGWQRLPKSTWILGRGHGVDVFPAAEAGFVYSLGGDTRTSADGWDWRPIPGKHATDSFSRDIVVTRDRVVAVGIPVKGDSLVGWFGSGVISR